MSENYILDTNTYALLFQRPVTHKYDNLINKIKTGSEINFYISEITSLEIYSVIGKYRRGIQTVKQKCNRQIISSGKIEAYCTNTWIYKGRKKFKKKIYHDILKLLSDIESQKGDIKATIIPLTHDALLIGMKLLNRDADKYNFGSLDAVIFGSVIDFIQRTGKPLTFITMDKGLLAVVKAEKISFFNPNI